MNKQLACKIIKLAAEYLPPCLWAVTQHQLLPLVRPCAPVSLGMGRSQIQINPQRYSPGCVDKKRMRILVSEQRLSKFGVHLTAFEQWDSWVIDPEILNPWGLGQIWKTGILSNTLVFPVYRGSRILIWKHCPGGNISDNNEGAWGVHVRLCRQRDIIF